MDQYASRYHSSGVDRRPGIVSRKSFSNCQTSAVWAQSPVLQLAPPRATGETSSSTAKPWNFGDPDTKR